MSSGIDNTASQDPMLHLMAMMGQAGDFIEGQEATGQRQLVASASIPTELHGGTADDLVAMGFKLGLDPHPRDPLFQPAELPPGWRKEGSDHAMWSYVLDQHGRRRLALFYKAAFYDRRAFTRINSVSSYAYDLINQPSTPFVVDEWATAERLSAALSEIRTRNAKRIESGVRNPEYLADHKHEIEACDALLARVNTKNGGA